MLRVLEEVRDAISVHFGSAKNQYAVEICSLQQRHEEIEFLFRCHGIDCVSDGFRRRTAHADFHQRRIAQYPCGQAFDLRWQCRREQQGLPVRWNFLNDAAHVRQKTHIEHPVHFIQHENFYRL